MTAEDYALENMQILGCDLQEIENALIGFATLKCKELLEIVAKKAEIEWDGLNDCTDTAHINKDSILNAVDLKEFVR